MRALVAVPLYFAIACGGTIESPPMPTDDAGHDAPAPAEDAAPDVAADVSEGGCQAYSAPDVCAVPLDSGAD